jgi:hypothetical protein
MEGAIPVALLIEHLAVELAAPTRSDYLQVV